MERGWKATSVEICPPCPRCGSSNTKFCYYNNYSLTQPRYFCKGCRRYWTKGGSLRNIPVGGGCRKTRRARSIRVSSDTPGSQSILVHGGGRSTGYVESHGDGAGGSTMMQPTNIDLQQVYSNFVNQRPQIGHQEPMHDDQVLHGEVDPIMSSSIGYSIIPNMEMEFETTNYATTFESFLSEGNGIHQFCGYNSIFSNQDHHVSNCGLPPLPGEELGWTELNVGFPEHVLDSRIEPEGGLDISAECSVKMSGMPPDSDTIFRP